MIYNSKSSLSHAADRDDKGWNTIGNIVQQKDDIIKPKIAVSLQADKLFGFQG